MQKNMLLTAAALCVGLAGCGNAELEAKLEKLEQRVEILENNGRKPVASTASENQLVEEKGPQASFSWEETAHDFGTISEGTVAEHTFTFTNTGEVPLVISKAEGSCGCTIPSYPKEPIPVGEQGEILVSFNSQGRTGNQQKHVSLTANTDPAITRLSIKSFVEAANGGNAGE